MPELEKFWSDDFDMDLLKLWPDLPKQLGETGAMKLWTVGHETHGRLNHPTVWNSHGAFVWTVKPDLPRDSHGWFNVHGCVSDGPEIECTWLELLRDQWPHRYDFILLPQKVLFGGPDACQFDRIMYHIRGWKPDPNIEETKAACHRWLLGMNLQLQSVMRLTHA